MLGVSKHTPRPNDDDSFLDIFKEHVKAYEKNNLCDLLAELKNECYQTMLSFNLDEVVNYALN